MSFVITQPFSLDLGLMQSHISLTTNVLLRLTTMAPSAVTVVLTLDSGDEAYIYSGGVPVAQFHQSIVEPDTDVTVTLLIKPNGNPVVNGTFDVSYVDDNGNNVVEKLPFTFRRARLFNFPVNWSGKLIEEYGYKTDIFVSRNGTESRRAVRHNPKITKTFEVIAPTSDISAKLQGSLSGGMPYPYLIPDYVRSSLLQHTIPSDSDDVQLYPVSSTRFVNTKPKRVYDASLSPIAVDDGFTSLFPTNWQLEAGDPIYPADVAFINDNPTVQQLTASACKVSLVFTLATADAASPFKYSINSQFKVNGMPVFPVEPSRDSYTTAFNFTPETVDYERGKVSRFVPISYTGKIFNQSFLRVTRNDADDIIKFFHMARGRLRPFLISTWNNDMTLASNISIGNPTVLIAGTHAHHNYKHDPAYRTIALRMVDGSLRVFSIESSEVDGSNTEFHLVTNAGSDINKDNVVSVSWMPWVRFASDILTVTWLTDQVAAVDLKFQTIHLPTDGVF